MPAIWRPQNCALVAIAEPAPEGFAAPRIMDVAGFAGVAAEIIGLGEWHLVFVVEGRRYRLWIRQCVGNESLAYVTPGGADGETRLAITAALHRQLAGDRASRPSARAGPGASERWRLVQWLRLLDALEENVPARELAATLLLADARRYSASDWDASSERRRIARWQRAALTMRDGGYRSLLSGR